MELVSPEKLQERRMSYSVFRIQSVIYLFMELAMPKNDEEHKRGEECKSHDSGMVYPKVVIRQHG